MARWKKTARWKKSRVAALFARDGDLCWLCNLRIVQPAKRTGKRVSIEHLTPRCRGGTDAMDNLVLCHDACNRQLRDFDVEKKQKIRVKWHRAERNRRVRKGRGGGSEGAAVARSG